MKIQLTTDMFETGDFGGSGDFSNFLSCLAGCNSHDGKAIATRISEASGVKHALLVSKDDGGWDEWDERYAAAASSLRNEYVDLADRWLYNVGEDPRVMQLVIHDTSRPEWGKAGGYVGEHTIVLDEDVETWCNNYIEMQLAEGAKLVPSTPARHEFESVWIAARHKMEAQAGKNKEYFLRVVDAVYEEIMEEWDAQDAVKAEAQTEGGPA